MARNERPLSGLDQESLEKLARGSKQDTPGRQEQTDLTAAEAREELKRQQGE